MNATALVATIVPAIRISAYICYQYPKDGLPEWFVQDILLPYEKVFCETATPYYLNSTHYLIINRATGGPGDYSSICWNYSKMLLYKILATWHRAFRGFKPTTAASYFLLGIDDGLFITMHLLLYLSPLAFFAMLFGLHIIRKVLHESDSHLYIYHSLLVFLDIVLYLFGILQLLELTSYLFLPGCLASQAIAVQFSGYITNFGTLLLESLFCFVNLIQALLALDRVFSVYTPVRYRTYAGARTTVKAIAAAFSINFILTLFESLASQYHAAAYTRQEVIMFGSALWSALEPARFTGLWLRLAFTCFGIVTQAVCCILVFFKLRRMAKHPVGEPANGGQISLVPCYLLAGTCGVNLVACITDVAYIIRISFFQAITNHPLMVVHWISVPACCCVAIIVHCVVSKRYREEIVKTFAGLRSCCCWKRKQPIAVLGGADQLVVMDNCNARGSAAGTSAEGRSEPFNANRHRQAALPWANQSVLRGRSIPNAVPENVILATSRV